MRAYLVVGSLSFLACVVAGCSGDSGIPDGGDDASTLDATDGGGDVVIPQDCDLNADIQASPKCIDDGIGVFVDATGGNDTGLGTKASPFKTITHAIGAVGAKPRIYVCAGTYAEDVSLTQSNNVSMYGGLACGTWTFDGNLPNVGKSTLALHVDGVTKPIVFSDLTFVAVAGANPGDSSIAAFVNASTDVTLRRVKLRPAAGKDGKAGVTGANWTTVAQTDTTIAGHNASGGTGASDHTCALCTDSVNSTGGGGGSGSTLTSSGGSDGKPALGGQGPTDGKGGASNCKAGDNGASATSATAAPGAAVVGKLTTTGWTPTGGSDGPNGGPGQGGGGGGGTSGVTFGGGGGGGCGGCGGAGGKGGGAGGASIGLAVIASKVSLVTCDIVTLAGGTGGVGSAGQDGQLGGYAGAAVSPGCAGGIGGQGAKGGAGGGGSGGISVGVLYTDQKPTIDQATSVIVPTSPAPKGAGGASGVNDGIDGVAQAILQASSS